MVEALVVGQCSRPSSGCSPGLGLAKLLFSLFDAVGFTLPNSGLLFETRTIVVALLVGIVVTLVASLRPAIRATRVPPIAAVREGATLPESRFARFRTPGSLLLTAIGFAALAYGLFRSGLGTTQVLVSMGVGALLIFLGVALFSARAARPLAALVNPVATWGVVVLVVLFWPFFTLPFWLLRLGAWGPGGIGRRVAATILGAVLNPVLALDRPRDVAPQPRDIVESRMADRLPGRSARSHGERARGAQHASGTRSEPRRRRPR